MKEKIYEIIEESRTLHDIHSTIELIDSLIMYGYYKNASDIHIDPSSDAIVVRFRIDGALIYIDSLSLDNHEEIIARIKILAGLRTDIHFTPQDGRFRYKEGICECDIRVSIIQTHYGENA